MSKEMISLQRKKDFKFILENLSDSGLWSASDREVPITQTTLFTQLILLMVNFGKMPNEQHAFEVFGTLCAYIKKNYSIDPAVDILAALELNAVRVGMPESKSFMIELLDLVCQTGYHRCGTSTLMPFLSWFHVCGISLHEIRARLVIEFFEAEKVNSLEVKPKPLKKKTPKLKVLKKNKNKL